MAGAKEIPVHELNVSQLNQLSQQLEQVVCCGVVTLNAIDLCTKRYH